VGSEILGRASEFIECVSMQNVQSKAIRFQLGGIKSRSESITVSSYGSCVSATL
jgi:hypothetical protein